MDGTRSGLTLGHNFRIARGREQLPFLRSPCPGLDLCHPRAASVALESGSGIGQSNYFGRGRQSEMKRCAPSVVRRGPQSATMGLDDGAADG